MMIICDARTVKEEGSLGQLHSITVPARLQFFLNMIFFRAFIALHDSLRMTGKWGERRDDTLQRATKPFQNQATAKDSSSWWARGRPQDSVL